MSLMRKTTLFHIQKIKKPAANIGFSQLLVFILHVHEKRLSLTMNNRFAGFATCREATERYRQA